MSRFLSRFTLGAVPRTALLTLLMASAGAVTSPPRPAAADRESFVRVSLSLPLRPLIDSLDGALPGDTLVRSGWEAVEGEVEVRWTAVRESLRVAPRRDTLLTTSRVRYRVDARKRGSAVVSCGAETPLEATVGVLTHLGWRADWGLESRSVPYATVHARICEPEPLDVELTEFLAPRLDALFHPAMGSALDTLVARDARARSLAEGIWKALQAPFETRVPGLVLDFAPRRMVAATPVIDGERITAELAVVVAPRLLWNEPMTRALTALPESQVRIAGDAFEVGFDVSAPFDSLRRRALTRCQGRGELRGPLRIQQLRLARDGDRLVVEARTSGAGTPRFTGTVGYDPLKHTIRVLGLEVDSTSSRSFRTAPGGQQALGPLRDCLSEGLQQDLTDWLVITSAQAGRALNRNLAPGIRIEGGIFERRAERVVVESDRIRARMIEAGKARILAEPAD